MRDFNSLLSEQVCGTPSPLSPDDILIILQMTLKCADLGHLVQPWDQHFQAVENLQEEMFRQGDLEKSSNQAISPLMDRRNSGLHRSQVGFIRAIAIPMYSAFTKLFPQAKSLNDGVHANLSKWLSMTEQ